VLMKCLLFFSNEEMINVNDFASLSIHLFNYLLIIYLSSSYANAKIMNRDICIHI
jgi:hypothetical protein